MPNAILQHLLAEFVVAGETATRIYNDRFNNLVPRRFDGPDELDEFLSLPSRALVADLAAIDGDIAVLGVGGKIGPSLARLARNAVPGRRIIGVARFNEKGLREKLEACGVETIA